MLKKLIYPIKTSKMMFNSPQRRVVVRKLLIIPPKRPNSARRKCMRGIFSNTRVTLKGCRKFILSYIPGPGHSLKKHSKIFIKGQGPRDLPCVYSSCIRGVLDLQGVVGKIRRRSIYGVRKR